MSMTTQPESLFAREEYHCERLGERYVRFRHASGLCVLMLPKQMHTLSAMLVVRYGAQDDRFAINGSPFHRYPGGVAHYLEHQLFTAEDGGTVDEFFSSRGAEVNAWTNWERTAYTVNATENVEEVLEMLLRFVTSPVFTDESVKKEQGIIAQEIRMVEDDPWETLHRSAMSALYPHHPITKGICGTERSISRITPQTLYDCYRAFYRFENMYLTVCGDMTQEELCTILDRALPFDPDAKALPPVRRGTDGSYDSRIPVLRSKKQKAGVSMPIFEIVWRDDAYPRDAAARLQRSLCMDVLSELLFSRAGVLYNRLVEKELITTNYSYGYTTMQNAAYHAISGESEDPAQILQLYADTLEEFRKNGISDADFERNRRVAYAGFISGFDDTEEIADLLADAEQDGCGVFDRLRAIDALTPQMIRELLNEALDMTHTTLAVVYPRKS